jgi:ABC-type nickel/cobalt efflux system permease component RcnA
MLLLGAIFVAGVLHGLGPDHLAAITAFGTAGGRDARRVVFFSTRFAAGHAVVIAIAGLLGKFGRLMLPPAWERRFDMATGALLVFTGAVLLGGLISKRISLHAHEHVHTPGPHRHFHLHWFGSQRHQHAHGNSAALLGALFAVGGARSLLAIVPIALANTLASSVIRIAAFVVGIIVAMVAYGLATQHVLSRSKSPRFLRASSYVAAIFCLVAGILVMQGWV